MWERAGLASNDDDIDDDGADGGPAARAASAAWARLLAMAGPAVAGLPAPDLARALLQAARQGHCRDALTRADDRDRERLAAARAWCHLRLALRRGSYDPGAPGERAVWRALGRALPPAWAEALEDAGTAGAGGVRPAAGAKPRPVLLPRMGDGGGG